jgi:hypothetical protein
LCYIKFEWNLIMLLKFHLIWLCYIFSIIYHVIIICGVSGWKSYFVVFYIYKVGVGFTSPSEPMCHPFGNDAPHIKLWVEPYYLDVWLPAYDDDEVMTEKLVSNNIKCYV